MKTPAPDSPPLSCELAVRFGTEHTRVQHGATRAVLELPLPVLAGPADEVIACGGKLQQDGPFHLLYHHSMIAGVAVAEPGMPPREAALSLYTALLELLEGRPLYRVWNYVPDINAEAGGLENYRAFNAGRHAALTAFCGPDPAPSVCAASALGTPGNRMGLVFFAGRERPQHFENPAQIPACQYPREYGEQAPCFARGTVGPAFSGGRAWYLAGTASILGHATEGEDFAAQARLTFANVQRMFQQMESPGDGAGRWRIFLRHGHDLAAARAALREHFPAAEEQATFLRADICRSSLLLEVESTLYAPVPLTPPTRPPRTLTV